VKIPKIRYAGPIDSDILGEQPEIDPAIAIHTLVGNYRYDSWEAALNDYHGRNTTAITKVMQNDFPGPYTIQQRYDSDRGGWYYTMEWEDETEKIFWLLKNT